MQLYVYVSVYMCVVAYVYMPVLVDAYVFIIYTN